MAPAFKPGMAEWSMIQASLLDAECLFCMPYLFSVVPVGRRESGQGGGMREVKRVPGKFAMHDRFVNERSRENENIFVARRRKTGDAYQS